MQEKEIADVSANQVKEHAPGAIIASEGEKEDVFYVILQGEVEILQNKKSIRVLQEGDVFGLENVYVYKCCSTTAKALNRSRIASYHRDVIEQILHTKPQVTAQIINSLLAQLAQTTQVAQENMPSGGMVDFRERIYQEGEVIIEEGSPGKDIYLLVGSERGLSISIAGKEVGMITRPGEYFGEMSSLLNQERTATVTSLGRSVVQVFPGGNLEATLCANPQLSKKIIDTLALRLVEASKRITELQQE
jgi:CRP-like cAMP-binding protein